MLILYCLDPLVAHLPDETFRSEAVVAAGLGITGHLVDHDALVHDHDADRAIHRIPAQTQPTTAVYRGWMMRADEYRLLYEALDKRNIRLINDPSSYRYCHHLPESYHAIAKRTPRSVWLPTDGHFGIDQVMELLRPFGDRPVVLKDFLKSRKHEWAEACFIPVASDRIAGERVVQRFIALQGPDLTGGLVFREFVDFEPLGTHSRSGMPLTREYRLFFLDQKVALQAEYWDEGVYGDTAPRLDEFAALAAQIDSRLFTMDVARTVKGEWMVVELGDGQVAGMPERADVGAFYRSLQRVFESRSVLPGPQQASDRAESSNS